MLRLTLNFWLFLTAATVTGGLLGRYLAAIATGHATGSSLALTPVLAAVFAFSATVLVRMVRATSRARVPMPARRPPEDL